MYRTAYRILGLALLLVALAACRREADVPGGPVAGASTDAGVPAGVAGTDAGPVRLEDVMESDPRYIIGISYPPGMDRYPGLAAELKRYADAARADLMDAVEAYEPALGSAGVPYDLTLAYDLQMETPEVVAVQAWGTLYTGGAHGNPLVARFVWLPQRDEMLRASALVTGEEGWRAISDFVRESLHAALSQRLDAEDLDPQDRMRLMRSGGKMIDDGTVPEPASFEQFEPVPGAGGRLRALRFVFPPYQVGPYSDGMQTVEVPASVLLPHLAPEYRGLFSAG